MSEDWSARRSKLESAIDGVLGFYLEKGCPCRFPRYRHICSFFHRNFNAGPVLSLETEYCCYLGYSGKNSFLDFESQDDSKFTSDYSCRICGSRYTEVWNQYSINFDCRYFEIEIVEGLKDLGAEVEVPIPLYGGMAGFDERDVELCRGDYRVGSLEEFVAWMRGGLS